MSPSSYFSIPPGLSPAELLDSPVPLHSSSNFFASPTTGAIPAQRFDWKQAADLIASQSQQDDSKTTAELRSAAPSTTSPSTRPPCPRRPRCSLPSRSSSNSKSKQRPWVGATGRGAQIGGDLGAVVEGRRGRGGGMGGRNGEGRGEDYRRWGGRIGSGGGRGGGCGRGGELTRRRRRSGGRDEGCRGSGAD
ncbi:putative WRKY transcription factor 33 [Zea mays]|nr:putative WRKY transcription factor 33 [Zea mays]